MERRGKAKIIHASRKGALDHAIDVLKDQGLVAFPTDTVYGLAAYPWKESAVARLYEAKERPTDRAIPLLLSDASRLRRIATLPTKERDRYKQLIAHFWPGGLTLVLHKTSHVLDVVSPTGTVATRIPALPLTRDLIRGSGGTLAVTSANVSGQPSPITAREVEDQLGDRIDLILDGGPCPGGVPSSILDCTSYPPLLLRRGAISEEALREIVGSIRLPEENLCDPE